MSKARICLIADLPKDSHGDEGMANVAMAFFACLRSSATILTLSPSELASPLGLGRVFRFRPNLIQYVPGPSLVSLGLLKMAKRLLPEALTSVYCIHPTIARGRPIEKWLAPDIALVLTNEDRMLFEALGSKVYELAYGVDDTVFRPIKREDKNEIRRKLGLPDDRIVLHVGPLKKSRNVEIFSRIAKTPGTTCILIASQTARIDRKHADHLRREGVYVIEQCLPNIHEFYQAADVYLFPPHNKTASIRLPLSILEALACGIPVVSTRFGAIPYQLGDLPCVHLANTDEEMISALEKVETPPVNDISPCMNKMTRFTIRSFDANLNNVINDILDNRN